MRRWWSYLREERGRYGGHGLSPEKRGILILPTEPVPQVGIPPSSSWGLQKPPRDRPTYVLPNVCRVT